MNRPRRKFVVRRMWYPNPDINAEESPHLMSEKETYAVSEKQAINNVCYRCGWKPINSNLGADELECVEVTE